MSFAMLAVKYPAIGFNEAAGQGVWSIMVSYPLGATIVLFLILTARPEPEVVTTSTRTENGMSRRAPV